MGMLWARWLERADGRGVTGRAPRSAVSRVMVSTCRWWHGVLRSPLVYIHVVAVRGVFYLLTYLLALAAAPRRATKHLDRRNSLGISTLQV